MGLGNGGAMPSFPFVEPVLGAAPELFDAGAAGFQVIGRQAVKGRAARAGAGQGGGVVRIDRQREAAVADPVLQSLLGARIPAGAGGLAVRQIQVDAMLAAAILQA